MANPSYRLMFKFWLDMAKSDEESVADIIERLKSARAFSAAIRDGLRLIWDLRQGKIDVLLELFPFVKAAIAERAGDGGNKGGVSKADLERLELLILQNHKPEMLMQLSNPAPTSNGLKPLGGVKQIAAIPVVPPTFDDEDDFILPVSKASGTNSNANDNFIKSMMALQQSRH